ncbi:MAG: PAS domain-containing protein [Bauldia sp.]|nr:PAS domain-containing protein [Bauldia sp.]
MKHASSRQLYEYWDRLRSGAPAPQRTAIEPADIRTILCDTFILEAGSRSGHPFRLAGTRLCAAFARELKGTPFLDIWSPGDRGQISLLLGAVGGDARAAVVGLAGRASHERLAAYEMLLLPLLQDGPRYDRILGVLAPTELPYWLGLDPLTGLTINSARLIWPDDADALVRRLGLGQEMPLGAVRLNPEARRERFVVLDGGKATR